jgi:hypothetical protein
MLQLLLPKIIKVTKNIKVTIIIKIYYIIHVRLPRHDKSKNQKDNYHITMPGDKRTATQEGAINH